MSSASPTSLSEASETPPESVVVAGVEVLTAADGPKIKPIRGADGQMRLAVNFGAYQSEAELLRTVALEGGYVGALETEIKTDHQALLSLLNGSRATAAQAVLRIRGAKELAKREPMVAESLARLGGVYASAAGEFVAACEQYVMARQWPAQMSPEVTHFATKNVAAALDRMNSFQRTLTDATTIYDQTIAPAVAELAEHDRQMAESESSSYKPPLPQEDDEVKEMGEGEIETRVTPFLGGYYRQHVYSHDPARCQLTEAPAMKAPYRPQLVRQIEVNEKVYHFEGVWKPGEECRLPLPEAAVPLPQTLVVHDDVITQAVTGRVSAQVGSVAPLVLMRNTRGAFSLEPMMGSTLAKPTKFSFDFVLRKDETVLTDPPLAPDRQPAGWVVDMATQQFLQQLGASPLKPAAKARRVMAFVKQKFKYPSKKKGEMDTMDTAYAAAGSGVFQKMSELGLADCHWSNIYAGELCKRLGVPHRVPTGFSVRKDPRFAFAAIAGTGHAWSEIWDGAQWIREDATPPGEHEDDEEGEGEGESGDGESGEQSQDQDQEGQQGDQSQSSSDQQSSQQQQSGEQQQNQDQQSQQQDQQQPQQNQPQPPSKDQQQSQKPDQQQPPNQEQQPPADAGQPDDAPDPAAEDAANRPELTPDQIESLFDELLEQAKQAQADAEQAEQPERQPTPEELAREFEQKTGVPLWEWQRVQQIVDSVNDTSVPATTSIRRRNSTIGREYEELFDDIIYRRRRLPKMKSRAARQSEDGMLDDPVEAVIDIRSFDDDPGGYRMPQKKMREIIEATDFEDDMICDVSGSMDGMPLREQQRMVTASMYNLMQLDRRLNTPRRLRELKAPIKIRTRVATFSDYATVLHDSAQEINEKAICSVSQKINRTYGGSILDPALRQYLQSITLDVAQRLRDGKLIKVLTITSDGDVSNKAGVIALIAQLRAMGVVVQGIGFGNSAGDIRLICNDKQNPDSGVVISDVREAALARHRLLTRVMKKYMG